MADKACIGLNTPDVSQREFISHKPIKEKTMKKGTAFVVLGLWTACLLPMSFGLAWERISADLAALTTAAEFSVEGIEPAIQSAQAAKTEEEIIAEIKNRKGKLFQIDVTGAGEGFDIYPRGTDLILRPNRVQFYPHGLIHIYFGSLKLTSNETPMWFHDWIIEWVDTEAKPGEKGYELKFESQEGDLFKGVTFTTAGFSFTVKAIKIEDKGDKVLISVKD
jgi:hypothetical protein